MSLRVVIVFAVLLAHLCCTAGQAVTTTGVLYTATNTNKAVVNYTLIPGITNYTITVVGGAGGTTDTYSSYYGRPVIIKGTLVITDPNITVLSIIAGERGKNAGAAPSGTGLSSASSGGGGGGSFVYNPLNTTVPIIAAGGASGQYQPSCGAISSGSPYCYEDAFTGTQAGVGYSGGNNPTAANNGASGNGYSTYATYNATGKGWNEIKNDPSARGLPGTNQGAYWYAQGGWGGGGVGVYQGSGGGGGYSGGGVAVGTYTYTSGGGGSSYMHPTLLRSPTAAVASDYTYADGYVLISTSCPTTNGTISQMQDACICASGVTGPACTVAPPAECVAVMPNTTQSSAYPTITFKAYTNNRLNLVLAGAYTKNRRFNIIRFIGSSDPRCALHYGATSYFKQSFSTTFCTDQFTLSLPWTAHIGCGFNQTAQDDSTTTWKGTISLEYEEFFTGYDVSRVVRQSYDVFVSFPRKLTVTTANLTLFSVVPLEYSFVGEWYDALAKELTLEIDTVLGPDAMIVSDVPMTIITPSNVVVTQQTQFNNTKCTTVEGTVCVQRVTFKLKMSNETFCTFNGDYAMNSTITACRNGSYCFPTKVGLGFTVRSGSVCTTVKLTPPISGYLLAYADTDFGTPFTMFSIGETAYFRANIDAGVGNNISLVFVDITYETNSGVVKQLLNSTVAQSDGTATGLVINNNAKWFSLVFMRSIFNIPINSGVLYTFKANVAITYLGNPTNPGTNKRTVQASWNVLANDENVVKKTTQTRVSIVNDDEEDSVTQHTLVRHHDKNIAMIATVAVGAAVVALAAGFVGVAIYFKRTYARGIDYEAVEN